MIGLNKMVKKGCRDICLQTLKYIFLPRLFPFWILFFFIIILCLITHIRNYIRIDASQSSRSNSEIFKISILFVQGVFPFFRKKRVEDMTFLLYKSISQ